MELRKAIELHLSEIRKEMHAKRHNAERLLIECVALDDEIQRLEVILEYDRKLSPKPENVPGCTIPEGA